MSLDDWFRQYHTSTPMTDAFLHGRNLLEIQKMLTAAVRSDTGLPDAPAIEFNEQVLSGLMWYAQEFDDAVPSLQAIANLNDKFVQDFMSGMVWDANQRNQYKRWEREGAPDPHNVPLPQQTEKEERNADPSAYLLRHPWGGRIPQF